MKGLGGALINFREDFKPKKPQKAISSEGLGILPDGWREFYEEFGVCCRKDEFIWIIDPKDYNWMCEIFDLTIFPIARTSFGDFFA